MYVGRNYAGTTLNAAGARSWLLGERKRKLVSNVLAKSATEMGKGCLKNKWCSSPWLWFHNCRLFLGSLLAYSTFHPGCSSSVLLGFAFTKSQWVRRAWWLAPGSWSPAGLCCALVLVPCSLLLRSFQHHFQT